MPLQPAVTLTSWVRVEGPRDTQSCTWCRRWVGAVMPVEFQTDYERNHGQAASHPCRCRLEIARNVPDGEDPGCLWA